MTKWFFDNRILFRIEDFSLAYQACATEGEVLLILPWKKTLSFQFLIHALANCAVGTICSDYNVAFVNVAVGKVNGHLIVLLGDVQDAVTETDLVRRNLLEEELVKLWSSYNVLTIASTRGIGGKEQKSVTTVK